MKKTLSLVLILCAFLCACTGKTEFSDSFICGEAEAYAVCEEGLLTASAGSVKCFDGAGEQKTARSQLRMPVAAQALFFPTAVLSKPITA